MTHITLQNILVPTEQRFEECPGLFFKIGPLTIPSPSTIYMGGHTAMAPSSPLPLSQLSTDEVQLDQKAHALRVTPGAAVSLCTYFNMLSIRKWLVYTKADNFQLEADVEGAGELVIYNLSAPDIEDKIRSYIYAAEPTEIARVPFNCSTRETIKVPIPISETTCVGFDIEASAEAGAPVAFFGGRWTSEVDEADLANVDICILTTTFQKEEYLLANMNMLREQVWQGESDLADHLDVIVVDNGRTLESSQVEGPHVRLFPNNNVGGAGGFARGMIEALRSDKTYTHALIMDDDVSMHPEAFWRTYVLLRLVRSEFADSYISGAMLRLNEMNIQHEDIGFVHPHGYFMPRKGSFDMYDIRHAVTNEVLWNPVVNGYAAWWYCCIPMKFITENTLPLPLFVRGDDVEFSLRNCASIISLAGICVWHMGFNKKFAASMEYYQVIRNSLILQACTPTMGPVAFFRQAFELVLYNIYQYAYDYADLILDAIEDYMAGPGFLAQANGVDIIREKGKLNETLVDIEAFEGLNINLDLQDDESLQQVRADHQVDIVRRLIRMITMNGHKKAPCFFYREGVGTTPYDWEFTTGNQSGYEQILAINPDERTAALRPRNMERFKQVWERLQRVAKDYKKNHKEVERVWQAHYPYLTSQEFWLKYLDIQ